MSPDVLSLKEQKTQMKMHCFLCATMALGMIGKLKALVLSLHVVGIFTESHPTRQAANPVRLAPTITTNVSKAFAVSYTVPYDTIARSLIFLQLIKEAIWL